MKKIYLLTATFIALTYNVFAQNPTSCNLVNDDFTNPALWSHPVLGTNLSDPLNYNTLDISSEQFNFFQSRDNNMNYMTRTGLAISNTDFVADIDLNYITNGIGAGGANHTVLALNAGTNPFYSDLSNIGGMPISLTPMSLSITTPQKGISISYESDLDNAPTLFQFKVYLNDGLGLASSITPAGLPVVIPGPLLPGGSSATYYIRLKRAGTTSGTLEIYSDFGRTVLIGSSTFTIPATINSLNTVFIGTNERQNVDNMLTGSLDNLCISNTMPPPPPPTCNVVYDDFSNAVLWTHPVLSTAISCPLVYNPTMYISSNKFNFGQSRDNNMNYFYRTVPTISNTDFRADIDFRHVTNGLSAGGAGHTLLALNDGTKPFFNETTSIGGFPCGGTPLTLTTPSVQNGIAVTFESDVPVAPNYFEFKVYLNVAGVITPAGTSINVGLANTQYFISLERTPTTSELRIYSDIARTVLVGTSTPFIIPASISGLNTVDIGTNEWQNHDRMLTGFLKNLCISNTGALASENFAKNQTKIFPNPTSDIITIESKETINQIELFDFNGRKIYSIEQESNAVSVNLDKFSKGIYMLQIVTNKGIEIKKIIKN